MAEHELEFASDEERKAFDTMLKAKVLEALADPRPLVPHEEVVASMKQLHKDRTRRAA